MFVPRFIKVWLLVSSLIVSWDCGFVLLRPATLPGGFLHAYWFPYAKYIEVDTLYKDLNDRFVYFQSCLNCIEILMSLTSLLILQKKGLKWQIIGAFLAFTVSAFTFWKTFFYWLYDEAFLNYNVPLGEFLGVFLIPNLVWLGMPLCSLWKIGRAFYSVCLKGNEEKNNKIHTQ